MRPLVALIVAAAIAMQPMMLAAQTASTPDTRVYLADGTVVMGKLLERSQDLIIVRGEDGEVFTFDPQQVDKIVTLQSLGSEAKTVTVREFPYISFLGGAASLALISWLQFDTASDRDKSAEANRIDVPARARELEDKADRARLWGWTSAVAAIGCAGVALIPKTRTKKVFPELSLDNAGAARLQLTYTF